ncbi:Pseudouridine synthase [uncultured Alphaproteobacteria bacterium]|uniref:Pseudouridine synthase n=1 Tax=uncultured Alphaproteobacteria bacterium TaxID=91750 RepID=A0A212KLI1_9PROT|nr:Pseudouridine synthase [uncultured Alphaproteobacteria bacterium]
MSDDTRERVAKAIARAGVCSRREAEVRIAAGRVSVNGRRIDTPATLVGADDVVAVDGRPLPEKSPPRLWRYHKPVGLVTTHKDPEGRPTVFERLPPDLPRVISVGRLDLNSEGLLLLTNDGELARRLELPANAWSRRYRVRVHGTPTEDHLARLAAGMTVEGVRYGSVKATIERQQGANAWIEATLAEGKNREIRRLMEALGFSVNRLIRVNYGPFALGALPPGAVEEIPPKVLRQTLGPDIAAQLPSAAAEGRERRRREQTGAAPAPKPKSEGDAHSARRKPPKSHRFDATKAGRLKARKP